MTGFISAQCDAAHNVTLEPITINKIVEMSKLEDSAFGLSRAELQQISYLEVLQRRKQKNPGKKFSDKLSLEAQIAMQQAMEDMENDRLQQLLNNSGGGGEKGAKTTDNKTGAPLLLSSGQVHGVASASSLKSKESSAPSSDGAKSKTKSISESAATGSDSSGARARSEKRISFSELYQRHGSSRMQQDITDEDYSDDTGSRQALGGGKLANAMEIIEFVDRENPSAGDFRDDDVIEELARINSVEKCEVWMQATCDNDQPLESEVFEQREYEAE